MSVEPDIDVAGLIKEYLACTALNGVTLSVDRGESIGLLGSNGAGKSTLLHILMGFTAWDGGSAAILGSPCGDLDAAVMQRVGFVAEEASLPPWATLRELAGLYASLYSRWDTEQLDRFIEEWDVLTDRRMNNLSKGQRRIVELALCFSCRPDLLLLDEPFSGLDAVMRRNVIQLIGEMNREGRTIVYSSHILSDVEKIADRIIILREGEICLDARRCELGESVEEAFVRHYGLDDEDEDDDDIDASIGVDHP